MTETCYYRSPIRNFILEADETGLTRLEFYTGSCEQSVPQNRHLQGAFRWLDLYFQGRDPDFIPALHMQGTEFQKQVWRLVMKIPYGSTVSYGDISREIANERGIRKMAAQAVGQAVGANRICLIIPCHRVIASGGRLGGYGGGIENKIALLQLENSLGDQGSL